MGAILVATLPAFLLVLLGTALAERAVIAQTAWPHLQKLNYFVFLPAMFLAGIATADYSGAPVVRLVVATAATLAVASAAVWAWRARSAGRSDLTAQIFEGAVRANVPYGMAVSLALGGLAGLKVFLLAAATYLPVVVAAGALLAARNARAGADPDAAHEPSLAAAVRLLLRNPIVLGAAAGIVLNVFGLGFASGLAAIVQAVGFAAIPVGLLGAGALLNTASVQNAIDVAREEAIATLAIKLAVLPLIAAVAVAVLRLDGSAAVAVIAIAALPSVAPRFSVATGGAAAGAHLTVLPGIVTAATLASVVTLPLALWLFA